MLNWCQFSSYVEHETGNIYFLLLPLYQSNTLSFPNPCVLLVDFQTAYKMLWCLCVLAGAVGLKNPDLYYVIYIGPNPVLFDPGSSSLGTRKSSLVSPVCKVLHVPLTSGWALGQVSSSRSTYSSL